MLANAFRSSDQLLENYINSFQSILRIERVPKGLTCTAITHVHAKLDAFILDSGESTDLQLFGGDTIQVTQVVCYPINS